MKKKALIRTNLQKYKELMEQYEAEWIRETQKQERETDFKKSNADPKSKVYGVKNDKVNESVRKMSLADEFKCKDTNSTFSFNFSV